MTPWVTEPRLPRVVWLRHRMLAKHPSHREQWFLAQARLLRQELVKLATHCHLHCLASPRPHCSQQAAGSRAWELQELLSVPHPSLQLVPRQEQMAGLLLQPLVGGSDTLARTRSRRSISCWHFSVSPEKSWKSSVSSTTWQACRAGLHAAWVDGMGKTELALSIFCSLQTRPAHTHPRTPTAKRVRAHASSHTRGQRVEVGSPFDSFSRPGDGPRSREPCRRRRAKTGQDILRLVVRGLVV